MSLASDARAIARAGVAAVEPGVAVRRTLEVEARRWGAAGRSRPLPPGANVHVVAVGKAAGAMSEAAAQLLGERFGTGIAVLPEGSPAPGGAFRVLRAGHPVPDAGSFRAGREVLRFVDSASRTDRLLFLISGGGSALLEHPVPPLTPAELRSAARRLLASGAPIQAMNTIRRHLSAVKGGRLAAATRPEGFLTLAISDVVGDTPWDVASGPTVPDPSTFRSACEVARRYQLWDRLPRGVRRLLRSGAAGQIPETPKPGAPLFRVGEFAFAATNRDAIRGAAAAARKKGFRPWVLSDRVVGSTVEMGRLHGEVLAALARSRSARARPVCLLSAGETTVVLGRSHGRGGRNQEFALAAAAPLAGVRSVELLSIGTDGVDGPTDAAGGQVYGGTVRRARAAGIDIASVLERHDAYPALVRIGGLVRTGPTGTNVMDLHVGLTGDPGAGRGKSSRPSAAPSRRRRRS